MLPEWPNSKSESFRYTDLSQANALGLNEGEIVSLLHHSGEGQSPCHKQEMDSGFRRNDAGFEVYETQTQPLLLDYCCPAARAASAHRLIIARSVKGTLIETITSTQPGVGAARQQLEIVLEEGAQLTHIRRQRVDASAFHWSSTSITLGRDAQYRQIALNTGAALARQEIVARLAAPGASCGLYALQLLSESQHGDITTQVFHDAPHTSSHQLVKNVLAGQARGVYQGQIRVAPGAQKTDGQQQSRALLLSPQAEMNTKPELEIFADDVKCSHGAAIGALDDTALFYLRARGIDEAQARTLLIAGFIGEVLEQAPESQRPALEQEAQKWLAQL